MAVETPPAWLQAGSYGAEQSRRMVASLLQRGASIGSVTGGIVGSGDCVLSPPGSGMSVNVAPGEVWVPGSSSATQSGYYCRVSSSTNLAIAASDPTNPRVDRVSAVVTDAAYSGGTNTFAVAVSTGTPTSGANLVNLSGVAAAPASSYTLGYVLVPATSTNVTGGNISNVAQLVSLGLPALLVFTLATSNTTAVTGQWLEASPGVTITLPAVSKNAIVGVVANGSVVGGNPVTVSGTAISGPGLNSASSFKLGSPGSFAILVADSSGWWFLAGQQDSGWQALSLNTNITNPNVNYSVAARLQGDNVALKGTVQNGTGGAVTPGTTIATVPTGVRPPTTVRSGPSDGQSISVTSGGVLTLTASWANSATFGLDGFGYGFLLV